MPIYDGIVHVSLLISFCTMEPVGVDPTSAYNYWRRTRSRPRFLLPLPNHLFDRRVAALAVRPKASDTVAPCMVRAVVTLRFRVFVTRQPCLLDVSCVLFCIGFALHINLAMLDDSICAHAHLLSTQPRV